LEKPKLLEKREMIQEIAAITRRMHTMGFNHRDFYCGHLFVRKDGDRNEWRVLDLQRVDRRKWFRRRWIVKDLAAIYFSAPRPMITRTDCMRFLVHYLGSPERVRTSRRLLRQIVRKTDRIHRHDRKLQAQRNAARSHP
jgi:heptose I phosphotransferase